METRTWHNRYRLQIPFVSKPARRAPDRGLVLTNPDGVIQLHAWNVATGELRQVTHTPEGSVFCAISPDGRYLYYHASDGGNELGHWVRVPFEGGPVESITPNLPPFASWNLSSSANARRLGLSAYTQEAILVLTIDVAPDGMLSAPREVMRGSSLLFGPLLSADGAIAAVSSTERLPGRLEFSVVVLDAVTGERVGELWDGEGISVEAQIFSPMVGDVRILARSNRTGMNRPLIWNPRTGERVDLNLDMLEGDLTPLDWSDDGRHVLMGQVHRATHHLHVYDLETGTAHALDHPEGNLGWNLGPIAYFRPDGEIYTHYQNATRPEALVALDVSGHIARTIIPASEAPPGRPWQSISFPSDGVEIQGWLCLPEGQGPFPMILHTHGGPTGVTAESYDPQCQAFVDHGFAFCTINYRGSTTFGREFQDSILGDPGRREVADMVAARDWLIEHDIARADQIILAGHSYGGYLTLMALGLQPDLWAGGMAGIPVTDWTMLYVDCAATLGAYAAALLGGTPENRPEQYRISSPLTYIDRVEAPVLIIFGRNDSRCPARPVEAYIDGLRSRGKTVEVYEFEGGHLGAATDAEEAIRDQEFMLAFAQRVLEPAPATSVT